MAIPVMGTITLDDQVTAPTAATVALAGAGSGNVDNGAHRVKVTFITDVGETAAGTQSSAVTVVNKAADGKVAITAIPVSTSPLVTGRNVYMSDVAATGFFLLSNGEIADNTSTTLTANDSDATLVASDAAPSANTTTVAASLYDALEAAIVAAGYAQIVAFAQLILSPVSGVVVLSYDPDIGAALDGFPIGDSVNFYAISPGDGVSVTGQYLFSETPGVIVAFYARPIL